MALEPVPCQALDRPEPYFNGRKPRGDVHVHVNERPQVFGIGGPLTDFCRSATGDETYSRAGTPSVTTASIDGYWRTKGCHSGSGPTKHGTPEVISCCTAEPRT